MLLHDSFVVRSIYLVVFLACVVIRPGTIRNSTMAAPASSSVMQSTSGAK